MCGWFGGGGGGGVELDGRWSGKRGQMRSLRVCRLFLFDLLEHLEDASQYSHILCGNYKRKVKNFPKDIEEKHIYRVCFCSLRRQTYTERCG